MARCQHKKGAFRTQRKVNGVLQEVWVCTACDEILTIVR